MDEGDREFVALLERGESERALRALHERHKDTVLGFLVRLLRDRALAEDVFQEAFLLLHANLDRFDRGRPVRPWLFRIARNAGLMALRVRRKDEKHVLSGVEGLDATGGRARPELSPPLERAAGNEASERVREALERLPDEARALLIQRHVLGMKLEELAESFACHERTIRSRLRAAGEALAQELLEPQRSSRGGRP